MREHSLPHLATRLFGCPLLIAPRKLEAIVALLGTRIGLSEPPKREGVFDDGDEDELAVVPKNQYSVDESGIARVAVQGPLVRKDSWLNAMCGMTSYAQIEQQMIRAVNDPAVKGILLDIDSPGGEAAGVFDTSDLIYSLRGQKPIYAVANEDMYSAAYAIGSAADKIFVSRTGGVGSIGVIAMHVDQSGADAKEGLKYTPIYAGARKTDLSPHEPLTDAARASMQAEIDRLYGIFASTVARNRGLSTEQVKNTEAGLFFGPAGVESGLADRSGTTADAIAALVSASRPIAATQPQPFQFASASAGAISKEGVTLVADTTNPADQTPAVNPTAGPATPQAPPVDQEALRKEALAHARAEASDILAVCGLAGKSTAEAQAFLDKGMSYRAVLKELTAERATSDASAETTSAVTPGMSTIPANGQKGAATPINTNILLEDAEERNKRAAEAKRLQAIGGRN